jgi:hypothetical protein
LWTIDKFCDVTGWQNRIHLEYWMAIRNVINPTADKTIGFYPCCGADALAFFLITDAEIAYFVDGIAFSSEDQGKSLQSAIKRDYYWRHKDVGGDLGGGFSWTSMLEATRYLIIPLRWELEAMGAEDISITNIEANVYRIDFEWAYWGGNETRHRSIVFFSGVDTRFPEKYPQRLKSFLSDGVDFYMEKAAKDQYAQYNAPLDWGQRWDQFSSYVRFNPASVIITTQVPDNGVDDFTMIEDESLKSFERNGAKFGVWTAVLLTKQQQPT